MTEFTSRGALEAAMEDGDFYSFGWSLIEEVRKGCIKETNPTGDFTVIHLPHN
jgi:hypothetical protein